ncbi:penicillin-binding protein 2 [Chthoniobacter flavus]|uniref:penicillin-binding protein 2 n=1 Tax=Chthoniobacter flavus TaxID=191863 RepID=UPI0002D37E7E|nr:penicillin-binding protein 2 [Chthoniobacter flavus]
MTPLTLALASAQEPRPAVQAPVATGPLASVDHKAPVKPGGLTPTWDTQKQARTYVLNIPAPRGQIVDRNGDPLAQTRVSYNLAINFPTPLTFTDEQVMQYAAPQIMLARSITGRPISITQDLLLKHYKNRGVLPLVIAQDLKQDEIDRFNERKPKSLSLLPTYQRYYPNHGLAGHIVGYAGRTGRMPDGPIQNNEVLWPGAEGREGLEQTFDDQLQGKEGQYNITFDPTGRKASEQVVIPPQPGYNVVTTLDSNLQRLCEEALEKGAKRGAIVMVDPNNGDILAMASWPTIDPNWFIPNISAEAYKALQDDPQIPMIPRAFRSSYPPGSTFKIPVGIAALQDHIIETDTEFSCPPSIEIGHLTFRNWKKRDAGMLNFADALTQSCDTWFYQVGIKAGGVRMGEWALKLGFGARTGIPLASENEGRIPNDEFMKKVHGRKMLDGDLANFSIGQGDVLVTPLQMAQAMAIVGNGGTFYQTRLVKQVQSIDGKIVTAYGVRARSQIDFEPKILKEVKRGMVQVVSDANGTAGRASVPNVKVAGKTGTAQWGPKNKERTAAWFSGFAPADKPKYAFAVVYESDVSNAEVHGGTVAAPLIGKVLREVFKDEAKEKKAKKKKGEKAEEPEEMEVRRAEPVEPKQETPRD